MNELEKTGITRNIDDLGRVAIPKEIRRKLKIREGDNFEIYVGENIVAFKKFSPLSMLDSTIPVICNAVHKSMKTKIAITDKNKVIYIHGNPNLLSANLQISNDVDFHMQRRVPYSANGKESVYLDIENLIYVTYLQPIIVNGELLGSVAVIGSEDCRPMELEIHAANVVTEYLTSMMK